MATFWEPVLGSLSDGNKVPSLLLRSRGSRGSVSAECLGPHCFLFDQLAEFCQVSRVESPVVCSLSGIQRREGETDRQTDTLSSHLSINFLTPGSSEKYSGHLFSFQASVPTSVCHHSDTPVIKTKVAQRGDNPCTNTQAPG